LIANKISRCSLPTKEKEKKEGKMTRFESNL
jgi:hypothetical protein